MMKTFKFVVQMNGVKFTSKSPARNEKDLKERVQQMYGRNGQLLSYRTV